MSRVISIVIITLVTVLVPIHVTASADVSISLQSLQIPFIENRGQVNSAVSYYAPTFGGTLFVKRNGELVLSLPPGKQGKSVYISEQLKGAEEISFTPLRPSPTQVNYFIGSDPEGWRTHLPTFESLSLGQVYPDIELILRASGGTVEKVFELAPGADPTSIRVRLPGSESLALNPDGALVVQTSEGPVKYSAPLAYQEVDGRQRPVAVAYRLDEDGYGFALGDYDRSRPLVIDPILQSTYYGGTGIEYVYNMALHPSTGDVYIVGYTSSGSDDLPGVTGASYQPNFAGGNTLADDSDVFVARLSADLTTIYQATYLGGSDDERGYGIAFHPESGDVYLTGETKSDDFPADSEVPGHYGSKDVFVALLTANLSTLVKAIYYGTTGDDAGYALFFSGNGDTGDLFLAGYKWGSNDDALLLWLDPRLWWEEYDPDTHETNIIFPSEEWSIGGWGNDVAYDLALDTGPDAINPSDDRVYIVGYAGYNIPDLSTTNFPVPGEAAQPTFGGQEDVFVARFDPNQSGTDADTATFLGDEGIDHGHAIELSRSGASLKVYITGYMTSPSALGVFSNGAQNSLAGGQDGFVASLNGDLTQVLGGSYFGGTLNDRAYGLQLGSGGDVYISGVARSTNLLSTAGGAQPSNGGYNDAFITRFNADLTNIGQATYFGGSNPDDVWWGLAIEPGSQNVYLAGETSSDNLPGVINGAQIVRAGSWDGFVALLDASLSATAQADIDVTPAAHDFGNVLVSGPAQSQEITISNVGYSALNVTGVSLTDTSGDFGLDGTGCGNTTFSLSAGQSCTVLVTFNPTLAVLYSATLMIVSNDPDEGSVDVDLSGTGVAALGPDISVSPNLLQFPDTLQAIESSLGLNVSNQGDADLTVTEITNSNPTEFIREEGTCGPLPFTLASGESCAMTVTFRPMDVKDYTESLAIHSNDPDLVENPFQVGMTGSGLSNDSDGDGIPDPIDDYPNDPTRASINTGTGTGKIIIDASANPGVQLYGIEALGAPNPSLNWQTFMSQEELAAVWEAGFPDGMVTFKVSGLTVPEDPDPGQTITVSLTFPTPFPVDPQYYKVTGLSTAYPNINKFDGATFASGSYTVDLQLTDGGSGDLDGLKNGTIWDPGSVSVYAGTSTTTTVPATTTTTSTTTTLPPTSTTTLPGGGGTTTTTTLPQATTTTTLPPTTTTTTTTTTVPVITVDEDSSSNHWGIFGDILNSDIVGYHLDGITSEGVQIYMPLTPGFRALKGAQEYVRTFAPELAVKIREWFDYLEIKANADKTGFLYKIGTQLFPLLGECAEVALELLGQEQFIWDAYSSTTISADEFQKLKNQGMAIAPINIVEKKNSLQSDI